MIQGYEWMLAALSLTLVYKPFWSIRHGNIKLEKLSVLDYLMAMLSGILMLYGNIASGLLVWYVQVYRLQSRLTRLSRIVKY
jgi:hypothetical protein